jgi:hypothetical protein
MIKVTQYIKNVVQLAESMSIKLTPCTPEQVDNVKEFCKGSLPKAYVEFLETMGQGTSPGFLTGHSCFINELFELREWADELLEETKFDMPLPDDSFVFWMSQGYQFAFFKLSDGDDPPVYYYREYSGQNDYKIISKSLSEFYMNVLNNKKDLFAV